jgi:hypothetical protein
MKWFSNRALLKVGLEKKNWGWLGWKKIHTEVKKNLFKIQQSSSKKAGAHWDTVGEGLGWKSWLNRHPPPPTRWVYQLLSKDVFAKDFRKQIKKFAVAN